MIGRDGRRIGVLQVGRPDGIAFFHFHGSGSSRLEVQFLAETASRLGIRLIGLDRPGIGRSDPSGQNAILDWPDTVADIADRLGFEKFVVEGMSAGGPYALACALKIPGRLFACGLIDALPPPDMMAQTGPLLVRTVWTLKKHFPRLFLGCLRRLIADLGTDSEAIAKRIRRWRSWANDADRALLADPWLRDRLARLIAENLRQGADAACRGMATDLAPWGFDLERIAGPPIYLWHGEQDRIVPAAAARLLARALPHCQAKFYPGEGHFSVLLTRTEDILRTLAATAD